MKRYSVEIKETLSRIVDVESHSPEGAIDDAMIGYYECKYVLDSEDFKNVEFNIKEIEK
jgi:hypothetical protein